MGKLLFFIALVTAWTVTDGEFTATGFRKVEVGSVRDGATIRTQRTESRSTEVRLPQDHRGVDCHDGMDRCNLHPDYATPGVQYHQLRTW